MSEQYQGWANYPTWNMALWLDNDYDTYKFLSQRVAEADDYGTWAAFVRSYCTRKFMHEKLVEGLDGPASDIYGWAADIIDYDEIARNWWDEYRKEATV